MRTQSGGQEVLSRRNRIYFIQEGEDGPIKIGRTVGDPYERMKVLQTGNSRPLCLLAEIETDFPQDEKDLHLWCDIFHVFGEWFRPDTTVLFLIDSLKDPKTKDRTLSLIRDKANDRRKERKLRYNPLWVEGDEYAPTKPLPCPRCAGGKLVSKVGRYGQFVGCTEYPECKYTESLE